ncbi:MAG: CpaF family protein [Acidobacteria bacterium]|nr:MAG: CpaF family protein [Acidobacteriota bacterium]
MFSVSPKDKGAEKVKLDAPTQEETNLGSDFKTMGYSDLKRIEANSDNSDEAREKVIKWARGVLQEKIKHENSGIPINKLSDPDSKTREYVAQIADEIVQSCKQKIANQELPLVGDQFILELKQILLDYQFGLGPIQPYLRQPGVEDVAINSVRDEKGDIRLNMIIMSRTGKTIVPCPVQRVDELLDLIRRSLAREGKVLNASNPIVNGRLLDGSRINALMQPLVDPSISVTIRVQTRAAFSFDALVQNRSLSPAAASFLWLSVRALLPMVIAGGTGAGKTNLLNVLLTGIAPTERIVIIEDTRELNIDHNDVVYLTTVSQNRDAQSVVYGQRDLVAQAMRMAPTRIVLGEVRDQAAWQAIVATNTGHQGTLLTIHAEDADSIINRLVNLAREAPETAQLPDHTLRYNIASGFKLFIHLQSYRLPNGERIRYVNNIFESPGIMRDNQTVLNPLFEYDLNARELKWTNIMPHSRLFEQFEQSGISRDLVVKALRGEVQLWRP